MAILTLEVDSICFLKDKKFTFLHFTDSSVKKCKLHSMKMPSIKGCKGLFSSLKRLKKFLSIKVFLIFSPVLKLALTESKF